MHKWEINHGEEMGSGHLIISSSTSATHSEKTQECQHPVEKSYIKRCLVEKNYEPI